VVRTLAALALASLAGPLHAATPIEPSFVRTQPFVLRHLDTMLAAARLAATNPLARPPIPSPCNATDAGDSVEFTWTDVSGETGYYVFRNGDYVATLGPDVTSYRDVPGVGTYSYCVMAFNSDGVSDVCCDSGTQTLLPPPSPCYAAQSGAGAEIQWSPSQGAAGYRVYRDGVLIVSLGSGQIFYYDNVGPGDYEYCVEAFFQSLASDRCCASTQILPLPSAPDVPSPCSASTDIVGAIRFTWMDVPNELGYYVYRDGSLLANLPAKTTEYLDAVSGSHQYCVRAFNEVGLSGPCCSNGTAVGSPLVPSVVARLSWGTCSPQVNNQAFSGPATYTLVLSARASAAMYNYGHDSQVTIVPAVPDAWRFDTGGCQTEQRLNLQNVAVGDSCPALLGRDALTITTYYINPDGSALLRLSVTYDDTTSLANQRYVLWKIGFDHTHSIAGTDSDAATCDGASAPLNFTVKSQIGITGGEYANSTMEPSDLPTTWNGGVPLVRTQPTTWGRVKALYR
jgi:hypothetical protein